MKNVRNAKEDEILAECGRLGQLLSPAQRRAARYHVRKVQAQIAKDRLC